MMHYDIQTDFEIGARQFNILNDFPRETILSERIEKMEEMSSRASKLKVHLP